MLRTILLRRAFLPQQFPGYSPRNIHRPHFICVLSFGRNTYADWRLRDIWIRRNSMPSDIAMFEWLNDRGFDPGTPNRLLGIRSLELSQQTMPIIGQWEALFSIWKNDPQRYTENAHSFTAVWPPLNGRFDTRRVLLEIDQAAFRLDLGKTPLLVTHPEHLPRSFFIARTIFGDNIALDPGSGVATKAWFDHRSVQRYTKNPQVWLLYELATRVHHRLVGWM